MRSELNWNMEVHNMPKRIWYFCAHVARNVTRHQKDRHLSSPENSHRRKSESELQRQRAKDFPIMIAGQMCNVGEHFITPHTNWKWSNVISSPPSRRITAQITVDLYGGTVSIVQHFLYTKISVQSKMLAHDRVSFQVKLQDEDDWRPGFLHQSGWLLWDELELWGKCVRCC